MSPIAQRFSHLIVSADYEEGVDPLAEMKHNLEPITRGVPDYATIDDVPLRW